MAAQILVTRDIPQKGLDMLIDEGFDIKVRSSYEPFTYDELYFEAKNFQYLLSTSKEKLDRKFLEANKHLKMISQFAAGFDNIDIEAATELGIPIGHTPQAMNKATSDIAFGLMIAVMRNFFQMHKSIEENKWGDFHPRANLGQEPYGKKLGIFGLGAIGFEMARKCKYAYDMEIIYCNRSKNEKAEFELGAKKVSFDQLLELSDVISVHCNLSEETSQIFDKTAFAKMKQSAIFINTSRGKVHHQEHLYEALMNKEIWGAGLDVTDPEPMNADNPLLDLPNVCVLPHLGSATVEARDEMSRLSAENLIRFIKEGQITHCVNPSLLAGGKS